MAEEMTADPQRQALEQQAAQAIMQLRQLELNEDVQKMIQDKLEKMQKEVGGIMKTSLAPPDRNQGQPMPQMPMQASMQAPPGQDIGAALAGGPQGMDPALLQQLLAQRMQGAPQA